MERNYVTVTLCIFELTRQRAAPDRGRSVVSTLVICRRVARKRFGAVVVRLRTEFVSAQPQCAFSYSLSLYSRSPIMFSSCPSVCVYVRAYPPRAEALPSNSISVTVTVICQLFVCFLQCFDAVGWAAGRASDL